jgi:hypothetical protein
MTSSFSGLSEIDIEFLFHAPFANNENGKRCKAGPQAGPNLVVNHGRSMIPDCNIEF